MERARSKGDPRRRWGGLQGRKAMKANSIGCQDIFLWISSIVGFIVDLTALIALISQLSVTNFPVLGPPAIPKLAFGALTVGWREFTLVLLVYVGIAFAAISIRTCTSEFTSEVEVLILTAFLSHFFAALVLLWLILFIPFGNFPLYLNIAEAWLTGFLILLFLRARQFDGEDLWQLPIACVSSLVLVLPAWVLLEMGLNHSSWGTAIAWGIVWGLLGILASFLMWIVSNIPIVLLMFFSSRDGALASLRVTPLPPGMLGTRRNHQRPKGDGLWNPFRREGGRNT